MQGNVLDHLGRPLPGTWVMCTGSRRSSAIADSSGSYRLEIPGATLEELERTPLKIRVQAMRKGWRFALESGAPELGLEMRITKDENRLSKLLVRSNEPEVVDSVANSVVLESNPRALVAAVFVGSQGAQYETPAAPLDVNEEITLAGGSSIPELAPASGTGATKTASAVKGTGAPKTAPATKTAPAASTPPPAASPTPTGSAPSAAAASGAPAGPPPSAAASPTVSGSSGGSSGGTPKKWNAAGNDHEGGKPRVYRPALDSAGTAAAKKKSEGKGGQAPAPSASPSASGPAADPSLKPVTAKQDPMSSVDPQPPAAPPSVAVAPPETPPAEPVPHAGRTPASPPAGKSGEAMCDCVIRGTIEVQSDKPLSSRTEVVLSIEDAPEVQTSVELFMGSPRDFEIHRAPCGVHRILLWTRSRQRFMLVSTETRAVCTPGSLQQLRLVLEPVARWGTTR